MFLYSVQSQFNAKRGAGHAQKHLLANTALKKEGTSGVHIPPRSIDYRIIGLDLRAFILCRFCVNLVVSPILEMSKVQINPQICSNFLEGSDTYFLC